MQIVFLTRFCYITIIHTWFALFQKSHNEQGTPGFFKSHYNVPNILFKSVGFAEILIYLDTHADCRLLSMTQTVILFITDIN